jgi:hypothetical protein
MCDKPNCPHRKSSSAAAVVVTPSVGSMIWNSVKQLGKAVYTAGEVTVTVGATAVALIAVLVLYPQDMGNNGYRKPNYILPPPIPPGLVDEAVGKRRKNRIPDTGEPNTTQANAPGTTKKVYGPNGQVQKEYNEGHGPDAPKNEQEDHVHDHKPEPNPNDPNATQRQPGRKPKPNEQQKDEKKQERRRNEANN